MAVYVVSVFVFCLAYVHGYPGSTCQVRARSSSGWLCGRSGAVDNTKFASFLGVPYAQQPVGDLRFKELQPVEPWDYFYDATEEGPICPQHDVLYGTLMTNRNMSEACIYANVHVPLTFLPGYIEASSFESPFVTGLTEEETTGLPIIVFVHGGGFAYGSGGTDLHGPEYLISKDVIVITFNYRLNVFGFLSLNSASIPGNNGLRDVVTLLQWVRENAKYFGGDPNDITLAGHSSGAAITHLLSLSTAAEGLFHKAILMSGTAIPSFYTTSPAYASFIANIFISTLGINVTDPEEIHRQLVALPLENIMEANKKVQSLIGITAFLPVVESQHDGVKTILDQDPEILLSKGRGKNIPLIIGYTTKECETFRRNFEEINILERLKANPMLILSPNLIYKTPPNIALDLVKEVQQRYFNEAPDMDKYIQSCSDTYYIYPAIKLAQIRAQTDDAPAFLYQFSYDADCSAIKSVNGLKFKGAGHIEDVTFMFKPNSFKPNSTCLAHRQQTRQDYRMADWLTTFFKNFMYYDDPTCKKYRPSAWPSVTQEPLEYLDIETPEFYRITEVTPEQLDMVKFFDGLQPRSS